MTARSVALIALIVSLAALVVSVGVMARRIQAHVAAAERPLWMFEPLDLREFTYAGRPVRIADEQDPDGWPAVRIAYGTDEIRLRATLEPLQEQVPGLVRHRQWLRVMRFAEHGRDGIVEAADKVKRGEITDRLAVVLRRPPAGIDPAALGNAGRRKWTFDFYELRPEGGFAGFRDQRLPERDRDRDRRVQAALARGEPDPGPLPNALTPGTWQADAAMMMMPTEPLFSAAYSPAPRAAMGAVRAMGWTLTSAAFSGLAVIASIVVFASARRRPRAMPA